jgi:hypothetical protein
MEDERNIQLCGLYKGIVVGAVIFILGLLITLMFTIPYRNLFIVFFTLLSITSIGLVYKWNMNKWTAYRSIAETLKERGLTSFQIIMFISQLDATSYPGVTGSASFSSLAGIIT